MSLSGCWLALHVAVLPFVPFVAAFVVSVQIVLAPVQFLNQVAHSIAAPAAWPELGSWQLKVETLVLAMAEPVFVLAAVAVSALPLLLECVL